VADSEEQTGTGEDDAPPELTEQRFAANLREARGAMSQYTLAGEMQDRGWPWRQQTVARVEAGQRMVRLGEATAIAEILQVSLDRLIQPTGERNDADLLAELIDRAEGAFTETLRAAADLITARRNLRDFPAVTAGITDATPPRLGPLIARAMAVEDALTPDTAITEAAKLIEDKGGA
jgi:transcriptional regulator with XRE-family HTH domain